MKVTSRIFTGVLALTLAIGMGTTAFAAGATQTGPSGMTGNVATAESDPHSGSRPVHFTNGNTISQGIGGSEAEKNL